MWLALRLGHGTDQPLPMHDHVALLGDALQTASYMGDDEQVDVLAAQLAPHIESPWEDQMDSVCKVAFAHA